MRVRPPPTARNQHLGEEMAQPDTEIVLLRLDPVTWANYAQHANLPQENSPESAILGEGCPLGKYEPPILDGLPYHKPRQGMET